MQELRKNALERFIPLVREKTGEALQEICATTQPKNILEIGTAIGYSALLMLSSCDANVCTLEKDGERLSEAKANFKKFGVIDRVETHLGDAKDFLEDFVQSQREFDFVFLDGPKGQYKNYYPLIKQILKKGGVLFADNVKLLGLIEHSENVTKKNRTMTRNMNIFIQTISQDESFECEFFDVDDGYLIAKKIN